MSLQRWRMIPVMALLVASPTVARAQTLGEFQWYGIGSTFIGSFMGANGMTAAFAGAAYQAQLKTTSTTAYLPLHGETTFGPVIDIYCVDFLHDANTSAPYSVNITRLSLDPMTKTRSADKTLYRKAGYLIEKMDALGFSEADQQTRLDIHTAIWNIMNGIPGGEPYYDRVGLDDSTPWSSAWQTWVADANQNYQHFNPAGWAIITDVCETDDGNPAPAAGCSQEFMARTVTPEPSTVVLMATGALLLLFWGRRFRPLDEFTA